METKRDAAVMYLDVPVPVAGTRFLTIWTLMSSWPIGVPRMFRIP